MRGSVLILALLASVSASAQPRLAFDAPRHDLGTFDEGEVATHTFTFENAGDGPVRISEVIAACGCTTPEWTQEVVAPGGQGIVRVAYESEGRPGPFEKTVRVVPEVGEAVTLRIVGNVVPVFVARGVRLGSLTFADVEITDDAIPSGERYQAVFRFQNSGERPVRIRAVQLPDGADSVFPSRPVFPGDVMAVLVNVEDPRALAADDSIGFEVSVETDDAAEPVKSLRISGRIVE